MTILTVVASLLGATLFFVGGLFLGRGKSAGGVDDVARLELEDRARLAEQNLGAAQQDAAQANQELLEVRQSLAQKDQEIQAAQDQAEREAGRANEAAARADQTAARAMQAEEKLRGTQAGQQAASAAQQENQRIKAELRKLQEEARRFGNDAALAKAETAQLNGQLQAANTKLRQMEGELTSARNQAGEWEAQTEDVTAIRSQLAHLELEKNRIANQNQKLQRELEAFKTKSVTITGDSSLMGSIGGPTDEQNEPTALVYEMDRLRSENQRLVRQVQQMGGDAAPPPAAPPSGEGTITETTQVPFPVSGVKPGGKPGN